MTLKSHIQEYFQEKFYVVVYTMVGNTVASPGKQIIYASREAVM